MFFNNTIVYSQETQQPYFIIDCLLGNFYDEAAELLGKEYGNYVTGEVPVFSDLETNTYIRNILIDKIKQNKSRYLVFITPPETIDEAIHTQMLKWLTQLDDDPFLDVSFGYITGIGTDDVLKYAKNVLKFKKESKKKKNLNKKFVYLYQNPEEYRDIFGRELQKFYENRKWNYQLIELKFDLMEYEKNRFSSLSKNSQIYKIFKDSRLIFLDLHGMEFQIGRPEIGLLLPFNLRGLNFYPSIILSLSCYFGSIHKTYFYPKSRGNIIVKEQPLEYSPALQFLRGGALGIIGHMEMAGVNNCFLVPVLYALYFLNMSLGDAMGYAYNLHIADYLAHDKDLLWGENFEETNILPWKFATSYRRMVGSYILYGDPTLVPFPEKVPGIIEIKTENNNKNSLKVTIKALEDIVYFTNKKKDEKGEEIHEDGWGTAFGSTTERRVYSVIKLPKDFKVKEVKIESYGGNIELPTVKWVQEENDIEGENSLHIFVIVSPTKFNEMPFTLKKDSFVNLVVVKES